MKFDLNFNSVVLAGMNNRARFVKCIEFCVFEKPCVPKMSFTLCTSTEEDLLVFANDSKALKLSELNFMISSLNVDVLSFSARQIDALGDLACYFFIRT